MRDLSRQVSSKIWVVTGAGAGIGLAMVRWIASRKGVVWALDFNRETLDSLAAEAAKNSWDVFTRVVDVTDGELIQKTIADIRASSKRIDVWVNNAGIQRVGAFTETTAADFDLVMKVNLTSVLDISRRVVQVMEHQGGGTLLNMASTAGHVPSPFMVAYVASKHGVVGFTKALQAEFELLRSPLRAAFASPGFVDTDIISRGKEKGFPEWLSWMLCDADTCASEVLTALLKGGNEIHPTLSGTLVRKAYAVAPKITVRSSKMLLSKGLKDFVLNRYQVPRS